jgi:hypothetical protein
LCLSSAWATSGPHQPADARALQSDNSRPRRAPAARIQRSRPIPKLTIRVRFPSPALSSPASVTRSDVKAQFREGDTYPGGLSMVVGPGGRRWPTPLAYFASRCWPRGQTKASDQLSNDRGSDARTPAAHMDSVSNSAVVLPTAMCQRSSLMAKVRRIAYVVGFGPRGWRKRSARRVVTLPTPRS